MWSSWQLLSFRRSNWKKCGLPLELEAISVIKAFTMWLLHWVLPLVLHCSFTGCDRTSSFCGRGKKTAWDTWRVYPEITEAFNEMLHMPQELSDLSLSQLERFVVLIYDRTSACLDVNEARKQLFTQRSRLLENIPPTQLLWGNTSKGQCTRRT